MQVLDQVRMSLFPKPVGDHRDLKLRQSHPITIQKGEGRPTSNQSLGWFKEHILTNAKFLPSISEVHVLNKIFAETCWNPWEE